MTKFSKKSNLTTILLIFLCINLFAQEGTNNDDRMKIRLGYTTPTNSHKQILVTVDDNSTAGIDFGYDAEIFNTNPDDMYWVIDNRKFVIQGIDNINENTILPLGVHAATNGVYTIVIDELQNVPEEQNIVVFDNENNTYHNIKNNAGLSLHLNEGDYLNRFELRFLTIPENSEEEEDNTNVDEEEEGDDFIEIGIDINIDANIEAGVQFQFVNNSKQISINNPAIEPITSIEIYSLSGQLKAKYTTLEQKEKVVIQTNNLKSGQYIIRVNTNIESKCKKILVK